MVNWILDVKYYFLLVVLGITIAWMTLWISYLVKFMLYLLRNNTELNDEQIQNIYGIYVFTNLMVIGYGLVLRYKFAFSEHFKNYMFKVSKKFFFQ